MEKKVTDLRTIKTQRAVQEALIQLLSEKDISKITVSELSQRAMINRKTFYRHYSCINDVLDEIENVIVNGVTNILEQDTFYLLDPHTLFHGINNLMSENMEFYSSVVSIKSGEFIVGKIREAFKNALLKTLREYSEDEAAMNACAEFAVSGILSLYVKWFSEGKKESLDFLADVACKMCIGGIKAIMGGDNIR